MMTAASVGAGVPALVSLDNPAQITLEREDTDPVTVTLPDPREDLPWMSCSPLHAWRHRCPGCMCAADGHHRPICAMTRR